MKLCFKSGKYLHDVSCVSSGLKSFGTFDFNAFCTLRDNRPVALSCCLSESDERSMLSERTDALNSGSSLFETKVFSRSSGIFACYLPYPFILAGLCTISIECFSVEAYLIASGLILTFLREVNGPDFSIVRVGELLPRLL